MSNKDFDSDDFDLEGFDDGFGDDKTSKSGTLGDLWRNNAFVKAGVILLGLALIIGIFIIFGGKKEQKAPSQLAGGSDITQTPGSDEISANIRTAIEDVNTQRLEDALRNQESTMPMPVNTSKGVIPFEMEQPDEEDPLDRWRRLQEEKVERAVKKEPPKPAEPVVDTRTPAIQALSQAMTQQMQSILDSQEIKGSNVKSIAQMEYLEGLQKKLEEKLEKENKLRAEQMAANQGLGGSNVILLPAGTIEYAQLLTEANTDVPGAILAEIVTGPFKGARLIGSFEETYRYLTLNFDTIVLDGVDYSISAIAIDPNTTLPGMITDIDRRYFKRVVLPVAAEFIEGFSQAISDSGTTTVTIQGDTVTETTSNTRDSDQEVAFGVATAGKELSSIIQEIKENNPPLLRVRSGTPMGILFIDAVTNNQNNQIVREEEPGTLEKLQNIPINSDLNIPQ